MVAARAAGLSSLLPARSTRNAGALLFGSFVQIARCLAITPVLTRVLGPTAYGAYWAMLALVYTLRPLVATGTNPIVTALLVQRPSDEGELIWGAVTEATIRAVLLWAALVAALCVISPGSDRAGLAACLGAILLSDAIGQVGLALSARLRDRPIVAAQNTALMAQSIAAVIAAWLGGGAIGVAACTGVGALLQAWLVVRAVRRRLPHLLLPSRARSSSWRFDILRAGAPSVGICIAVVVAQQCDIVISEALAGRAQAAAYAGCARVLAFAYLIPQALATSLLPVFAERNEQGHATCLHGMTVMAALALPVALLAPLYAPGFTLLLGSRYALAATLAPVLVWRTVSIFAASPADMYFIGTGRQRFVLGYHAACATTVLVGCALLTPTRGVMGTAIAVVAGEAVKMGAVTGGLGLQAAKQLARALAGPAAASGIALLLGAATPGPWWLRTIVGFAAVVALCELPRVSPVTPLTTTLRLWRRRPCESV